MKSGEKLSMEQIKLFPSASEEFRFEASNREEVYGWVNATLVEHEYGSKKREAKRVLRSYIEKMTGLSRAQGTRLIARYQATGVVKERTYRRNKFIRRYLVSDIKLLAEVDEAHETLSGPATRHILYREFHKYGRTEYKRLAAVSAAHIYNFRFPDLGEIRMSQEAYERP